MQVVVLLEGPELKCFCKELNITPRASKIMIKISEKRAEYYNFDDDCFYRIDIEIAKKYISKKK